ncbi:MAG: alkaline phosphatase PhoX [Solirubrobacteraceae bacterium]
MNRREFLRSSAATAGGLALSGGLWREALAAAPAVPAAGPYGPLLAQDANGIRLPQGFTSRKIAHAGQPVAGTDYVYPVFPDGQATFATEDGGFILVTNSEAPEASGAGNGGASAIRFDRDGRITDAYRILGNTTENCAGGKTPWGTWMSCEETKTGLVYECDPFGVRSAVAHPAMGVFEHEAICVDPHLEQIYLSEDSGTGGLYRFTPERYPDCSAGLLEIAMVAEDGAVRWSPVPDPAAQQARTADQVEGATRFARGEGIWFDSGIVYLATTGDDRIWAYNTGLETIEVLYDGKGLQNPPFQNVDNICMTSSGDLFVCEDPGNIGMGLITPDRQAARFLEVTGVGQRVPPGLPEDIDNEITGVIFDPSGTRMYFSAQRSFGTGVVYEVTGPFRRNRVDGAAPGVRIDAPAPARLATVRRKGLRVTLHLGEDARLNVVLRARLRGKTITLARRRIPAAEVGETALRLRLSRVARQALRGRRSLSAVLEVSAVDAAGLRTAASVPVRLTR